MDVEIHAYRLIGSLPVFAVWLVGCILCATRYRRQPTACALTAAALAIAAATRIVLPVISTWVFMHLFQDVSRIHWRVLVDSIVFSIPQAIEWGLLLWVIFGPIDRPSRSEPDWRTAA